MQIGILPTALEAARTVERFLVYTTYNTVISTYNSRTVNKNVAEAY